MTELSFTVSRRVGVEGRAHERKGECVRVRQLNECVCVELNLIKLNKLDL